MLISAYQPVAPSPGAPAGGGANPFLDPAPEPPPQEAARASWAQQPGSGGESLRSSLVAPAGGLADGGPTDDYAAALGAPAPPPSAQKEAQKQVCVLGAPAGPHSVGQAGSGCAAASQKRALLAN